MRHARRPVQSATVNRCIATISAVLNYAHERGWYASPASDEQLDAPQGHVLDG